jgi:hypothetical protein
MADAARSTPQSSIVPARRVWTLPVLSELPKLTDLTLASAIGGGGGTGGGGSTVFGFLMAVGLLAGGCTADRSLDPSSAGMPRAVASIPCVGDVATKSIRCGTLQAAGGTLQAAPGQEILGGQGTRVALRSSNVGYNSGTGDFTFDVTVQNLAAQELGWDGTSPTGVRVFFEAAPVPDIGTVTIEDDSVGTFTAGSQAYYLYPGSLTQRQVSGSVPWRFNLSGGATTFTFNVLVATDVFDQGGVLRWQSVNGLTQRLFNDVVASAPNDWMAVSGGGITAHWNGSSWVTLPSFTGQNITAVTAIGPGEYLAATNGGAVLRFHGNVWSELYRRADNQEFTAIWAKDASTIVAAGYVGAISRLSGGTWSDDDAFPPSGQRYIAVAGNADGSLVSAITGANPVEVYTSTAGGAFTADPAFAGINGVATDIVYDGAGHALLGYLSYSTFNGMVVSSTGDILLQAFAQQPTALVAVGTDKAAVGLLDLFGAGTYIDLVDYSGPPSATLLTTYLPGQQIADLTATDAAGTQFEMTTDDGHLFRWDGVSFTDSQGANGGGLVDLWGIADTVWMVDGTGSFYRIVDGAPTALTSVSYVYQLAGVSSTEFYVADATYIYRGDGVGAWTIEDSIPAGNAIQDLWADPTGTLIVLGNNGDIMHRITGVWTGAIAPGNLTAVWGCDASTAWITTEQGVIYLWQNGVVIQDPGFSFGAPVLHAVTGTSCSDVWVGGDNGVTYHWDGLTWTDHSNNTPGWHQRAISVRGPGQLLVAGDAGTAGLVTDGAAFQFLTLPTQNQAIRALWRLDNGEVLAAGTNVLLRGLR